MGKARYWLLASILIFSLSAAVAARAQEGEGNPERGGELYVENCAVCHGVEGGGRVGASLQAFSSIDPDAALVQVISEGIEGSVMPAWGEAAGGPLTEAEIHDIASYIRASFGGTDPIAPAPTYQPPDIPPLPEVEGDPSQGAVVYQANCVMCHGEAGRGRFGSPLAKSWPGVEPAVYVHNVVREGIAGTTMPPWSDEQGGPLSAEQVEDVSAYVLSLAPAAAQPTPPPAAEGPLTGSVTAVALGILAVFLVGGLILYYRRA